MRYEELPGPLTGWTYDDRGTIYTASGYKCNARTLECALWLFQCYSHEARKYLIRSDEAPGATRPLYELRDAQEAGSGKAKVRRVQQQLRPTGTGRLRERVQRLERKNSRNSFADASASKPP